MILLRHTRTVGGHGRCHGRTDLALAASFEGEAEAILLALPTVHGIVTSPLSRCARLAELIGERRGLPVTIDPRLAEMDFGRWEGLVWDDVPRSELDAWAADFHEAKPHGGESVAELATRVAAALADLPDKCLAVTHDGVIRAALAAAGRDASWKRQTPFGTFVAL